MTGVANGPDLALDTADSEPARNQHRVHVLECGGRSTVGLAVIGGHPPHLHLGAVRESPGAQRLGDREVGIREVDVLAHQRDSHVLLRVVHPAQQVVPGGPIHVAERQVQPAHHVGVEFLPVQHLGDVVDRRRIRGGDHAVDVDVAHQRDLVLQRLRHVAVTAQDQRVRRDADAAQGGYRMLGGFGLQLPRRRQKRDQRDVQEEAVLPADRMPHLPGCLQERLRLDVADGAADLGDDDVGPVSLGVGLSHLQDAGLDLVGDVRDHLHGVTEVLAAALLGDDGRINLSGGHIRRAVQIAVQESLVVADVEIGFGAVLGDEHLAVLERVHGAGVDIEIGIEFLHGDLQAASGEQLAQAAGGEAFAERGHHTTGHEEMFGGALRVLAQCWQERPP